MSRIVMTIGCAVVAVLLYAVPILCVLSIVFHWDGSVQAGLVSLCVLQIGLLTRLVLWLLEEEFL